MTATEGDREALGQCFFGKRDAVQIIDAILAAGFRRADAGEVERLTKERDEALTGEAIANALARKEQRGRAEANAELTALRAVVEAAPALAEALKHAVAIIRQYVPADALGTNSQGGGDGWNDQSWPILDEHLHYMDQALTNYAALAALPGG